MSATAFICPCRRFVPAANAPGGSSGSTGPSTTLATFSANTTRVMQSASASARRAGLPSQHFRYLPPTARPCVRRCMASPPGHWRAAAHPRSNFPLNAQFMNSSAEKLSKTRHGNQTPEASHCVETALTFVIPLRHPYNSTDWSALKRRLAQTIRSIAGQDDARWRAIIVANEGSDLPQLPYKFSLKQVDFPPNPLFERGD